MTVAALYVDVKRGPYAKMEGVECWGVERDATTYDGPWPVVAHPPCGHWGRYHQKAHDDGHTGPIAVEQVRRFGGVLEHPRDSKLWRECRMPLPGHLPDEWGGYTVEVYQRDWGHRADKATWLYIVGCKPWNLPDFPEHLPPVEAPPTPGRTRGILERLSKTQRHLTPPAFAAWLVDLASRCHR
jgi:hypothetical protein